MRRWCLWAAGAAEIEGKADWENGGEGGGGWDAAGASAWTKHMDGGAHGWKSRLQRRGNPYRWSDDATDETTWDHLGPPGTAWDHLGGPGRVGVRVWGVCDEGSTRTK